MSKLIALYRAHAKRYLVSSWFLWILALKMLFSFLFANDVLVKGFAPFVDYFVQSGFQNPYNHFLELGLLKAFPYSTVMLWILAIPRLVFLPLLHGPVDQVTPLYLFFTRIPILLADVAIYLALCLWLPAREKKVLWLYWASPMLFYINYFHGQLDVIPTAILMASLAFLFTQRQWLAYMLLGVGIAAKAHLFAALPFYFIYAYIKRTPKRIVLGHIISALAVYGLLTIPYIFSSGYQRLVLGAEEQWWVFLLNFPYPGKNSALLLAPAVYLLLFFRFASYRKLTADLFLMMLGLMFAVLVVFVPPMPGWFYWSVPFLAYFYIKKPEAPTLNLWLLNGFFLAYFLFNEHSDLFRAFQVVAPSIASLPTPYAVLERVGINVSLISNLFFTALEAALVMNVVWCYKVGVRDSLAYKEKTKPLLIGIAGDSGAGKTTLAMLLTKLFHERNVLCIRGDDAHRWPRGHQNWQVFTHLDPKSNRLHQEFRDAIALKTGHPIERVRYDHVTGTFTDPIQIESNKVIVFEGLHPYSITRTRDLFDVKIFLEPHNDLRAHWKIIRDGRERGYSREKILEQLAVRRADADKFVRPQRGLANVIIAYEPTEPIVSLGSSNVPLSLRLKITFDNSLDVEPLVEALARIATLDVEYLYEDLNTVTILCKGEITTEELERIAYTLIPNLRDLTPAIPEWESNLAGVTQLFVLYYLSEMSKLKEYASI